MRATQRITWLLLLLLTTGVLFHICTADDSSSAPSVSSSAPTSTASPTVVAAGKDTVQTSPPIDTKAAVSTTVSPPDAQTTTLTQAPTTVAPTSSATVAATAKPTSNAAPTQSTTGNVPTDRPAAPTTVSGAPTTLQDITTTATVTAGPTTTKTLDAAATTTSGGGSSSSGGLAVTTGATTTQVSNVAGVDLSGTGTPGTQQGVQDNVGTTKSSTDAAPSGAPTTSHTAINSETSQQAGKGDTEKITVTVTNGQPTASRTAQPPVNTGTTLNPPTKSAETSGTRTEATAPLTTINTLTDAQTKKFQYSLNAGKEKEEKKELVEVCRQLMVNMEDGNCTLTYRHHNEKIQFDCVEINGKVKTNLATQIYEEITRKQTDNKTLIAILASCGALLIMIVILAVCASHHRKPYHENQQHLTEELHTVENGYHDNPTLEVMEVQPEMQEKKMALNGEFNDSWIVPIDNLLKEDIPDEEDTHL